MHVLVVEDYAPLREAVVQGLREAGYAVDAAADGDEGLWAVEALNPDVLVLDLMLPKLDGLALLARMRQQGHPVRVLILTAKDAVDDRVRGLNLGADDYLVKPFAFAELLARVAALVRRRYDQTSPVLRVGDLVLDTIARTAQRGPRPLDLTAQEYQLLAFLVHRAGAVVTRAEIVEHLYDFAAEPESNVVDVYVGYLRRKLELAGEPRLIHTRRGLGYQLTAAGEPTEP